MRDRTSSIQIITASAGSGKTFTLAVEYLSLLRELIGTGNFQALRSIVAITFTNKAAKEMKERILFFLKKVALGLEDAGYLKKLTGLNQREAMRIIDLLLNNYSDFQVKTIDSFLLSVLRALSFEMGLDPEMKVEFSYRPVVERAFSMLMAEEEAYPEEISTLLETYLSLEEGQGFYPEKKLIDTFCKIFPFMHVPMRRKRVSLQRLSRAREEVERCYKEFCESMHGLEEFLNKSYLRGIDEKRSVYDILNHKFFSRRPEDLFKKNQLERISPTRFEVFKRSFDSLLRARERYLKLEALADYYSPGGYIPFFNLLRSHIDFISQRERILFTHDWTARLKEVLTKEFAIPLVFAYLGGTLLHFFIDEFQDTSRAQWDALFPIVEESLSQGGSLFVVGDIKQAIYRWRGGDWRILQELPSYFSCARNVYVRTLEKNYRSHPELVKFFNDLFAPLTRQHWVEQTLAPMIVSRDSSLIKQLSSSLSRAFLNHTQLAAKKGMEKEGRVCFFQMEVLNDETRLVLERHFVEKIRGIWTRGEKGKRDVAVLVRTNEQAQEVSAWLIRANLPVLTENSLNLRSCPVVRGMVCFLSLLIRPSSSSALYGTLNSGLIPPPQGPRDEGELIGEWVRSSPAFLKWKQYLLSLAEEIRSCRDIPHSPYDVVRYIMERLDIPRRITQGDLLGQKDFLERFLELVHDFQKQHGSALVDLLSFLWEEGLESKIEMSENVEAIRVITIHKAKGLEFSTVFIPFTNWIFYNPQSPPLMVKNNSLIRLTKKASGFEKARNLLTLHRVMEIQEVFNLFYVAITRAITSLYCYITPYSRRPTLARILPVLLKEGGVDRFIVEMPTSIS